MLKQCAVGVFILLFASTFVPVATASSRLDRVGGNTAQNSGQISGFCPTGKAFMGPVKASGSTYMVHVNMFSKDKKSGKNTTLTNQFVFTTMVGYGSCLESYQKVPYRGELYAIKGKYAVTRSFVNVGYAFGLYLRDHANNILVTVNGLHIRLLKFEKMTMGNIKMEVPVTESDVVSAIPFVLSKSGGTFLVRQGDMTWSVTVKRMEN